MILEYVIGCGLVVPEAAVKIEPESPTIRFTRRVRHDRSLTLRSQREERHSKILANIIEGIKEANAIGEELDAQDAEDAKSLHPHSHEYVEGQVRFSYDDQ